MPKNPDYKPPKESPKIPFQHKGIATKRKMTVVPVRKKKTFAPMSKLQKKKEE